MIPFDQAFNLVMSHARMLDSETVAISESLGRILAEDVRSDMDMPPFDKSAMDGYACRRADLGHELEIVEVIQAGKPPLKAVGERQCAKIMTGAMLPEGADCVFMIEYAQEIRRGVVRFTGSTTHDNICRKSEDIRAGDIALRRGARIAPQHVAVLATVGCIHPRVYRKVRVGIIATGDELVEPDQRPGPSQIRTSNSHQLRAQALAADTAPAYYGIARDTRDAIDGAMKRAMAENDVILLSGGVSKGDYDLVPDIMTANGIEILFDSIAMKPGKPTTFGVGPGIYCFGMPGNPVSTFIQFEILVKPFLYRLMGHDYRPPYSLRPLASPIKAKGTDRETWLPVKFAADGRVEAGAYHGSAHINALCDADGLIVLPAGAGVLEEGTLVRVRPL
ncbi:MAG TPA: molybdopterin molybdotransferase MoeA [Candidatus Hydrogenedentes bacterium]|nr:molybdopterin molybdotransferase MoeA [Candidatus Hydrogenedentota bacterium]